MPPRYAVGWLSALGVVLIVSLDILWPWLVSSFHLPEERISHYDSLLTTIVVLVVINLVYHFSFIQTESTIGTIRNTAHALELRLSPLGSHATPMPSDMYYVRLLEAIGSARGRVNLSFFGDRPPDGSPTASKRLLFGQLHTMWSQHTDIRYKLLVIPSPSTSGWIAQLAASCQGFRHVSIGLLRMPVDALPPISTQVIDDHHVFIDHLVPRRPDGFRDLALTGSITTSLFHDYYSARWQTADILLDHGVLSPTVASTL